MNAKTSNRQRLIDMPTWRLIVLLDDLEREVGADSQSARVVARHISERLRNSRDEKSTAEQKAVCCG
jgi:hypothetical protein